MSDNVYYLTERLKERPRGLTEARGPHAAEEKNRALERMRLREVQALYKRWPTRDDRLRVARVLGELVAEANKLSEPQRKNLEAIKKEWAEQYNGAPIHMHRYMIAPETDLSDQAAAAAKAKNIKIELIRPYVDRAVFIGKL